MIITQRKISLIISIAIHALFILLLFLIKINWQIPVPEFIEVRFERGSFAELNQAVVQASPAFQKDIELPIRHFPESEKDVVPVDQQAKLVPKEEVNLWARDRDVAPFLHKPPQLEDKQIAEFPLDAKLQPDEISDVHSAADSRFEIEGTAAQRTILMKVIPHYPSHIQQEAIVKIRFTVLPNGLIGELIPILRGDDVLEKNALEAFKQWRFNPLPPHVPQLSQQGTITFKYLLK